MTAQGEGNPVCCFLLSFPEFVFNLWRIPVHAAKFLGNREKSIMETKPDYSLPSANPSLSSGRGRCFGAVLVSGKWIYIFHLCSPHGEERKKKKKPKTPTFKYFILFCRTLADLSLGTINSFLTVTAAPELWCGTLGEWALFLHSAEDMPQII